MPACGYGYVYLGFGGLPSIPWASPSPPIYQINKYRPSEKVQKPKLDQIPLNFSLPRFSEELSGVFPIINYKAPELVLPTLSDILIPVYSRLNVPSISFDEPQSLNISVPDFSIGSFRVDFLRPMFLVLPDTVRFSKFVERIPEWSDERDFTVFISDLTNQELPVFYDVLRDLQIPVDFGPFSVSGDIFEKLGVRVGYLDMKFRRLLEFVNSYLWSLRQGLAFRQLGERLFNYLSVEKVRLSGYESKVKVWLALLKLYARAYFENLGGYLKRLDAFMKTEGLRFGAYLRNVNSELEGWRENVRMREIVNKVNLKANAQNLDIIKNIIVLDGVYRELLSELLVVYNAFLEIDVLREQLGLLLLKRDEAYREREIVLQEERILDEERRILQEERDFLNIELSHLRERYDLLLRLIDSRLEVLRSKESVLQTKFGEANIMKDVANVNAESQEWSLKVEAKETYYQFTFRALEKYFSLVREYWDLMLRADLTDDKLLLMHAELERELNRLRSWYHNYVGPVVSQMVIDASWEREIAEMLANAKITSTIIESYAR